MFEVTVIFNSNRPNDKARFDNLEEAKQYGLANANTFDKVEIRFHNGSHSVILVADMYNGFEYCEV